MNTIFRTFNVRPAARFILFAALLAFGFVGSAHSSAAGSVPVTPAASQMLPVETLLNADGTLNTSAGASGAVDPRGWNVTLDPKRGPLFQPADSAPASPSAGAWSSLGTGMADLYGSHGTDVAVSAIAVSGSDVYAGGYFDSAGTCTHANGCINIAKWNGSTWSALSTGTTYSGGNGVFAIAISGNDVYAGGSFTSMGTCTSGNGCNFIAKWNGSTWSPLGTGMGMAGGSVYTIAISGTDVYAGGSFTSAGTCNSAAGCNHIAKWNGSTWSALGTGTNNDVDSITISGNDVYAGGYFTSAGTCGIGYCNYIARWNTSTSTWSALGLGMSYPVWAVASNGSDVYASALLSGLTCPIGSCTNIAKWDGSAWSALGSPMNDYVRAIAVNGSDVYAVGFFTQVCGNWSCSTGNLTVNRIAKWDGSVWSALGTGMNQPVESIAISGSDVYAGGNFTSAGTCTSANGCNGIAKYGWVMKLYLPLIMK